MAGLWRSGTRGDRAQLAAGVALVVALVAGYEIQTHRPAPGRAPLPPGVSLSNPEVRLAAIQVGHRPGKRNGFLAQFSGMLDILVTDCPADTRVGLVNMTLRGMSELRGSGIASTPNQVLGGVVGAVDLGSTRGCAGIFEQYVAKRRSQATASGSHS